MCPAGTWRSPSPAKARQVSALATHWTQFSFEKSIVFLLSDFLFLIHFLHAFIYFERVCAVCMCVYEKVHGPLQACGGHRTVCRVQLSPSTMRVLGMKLGLQAWQPVPSPSGSPLFRNACFLFSIMWWTPVSNRCVTSLDTTKMP